VIAHRSVEPKGLLAAGDKPCTGQRITTGEQGDVVSLLDELANAEGKTEDQFRPLTSISANAFSSSPKDQEELRSPGGVGRINTWRHQ
jgi:hypothetical protein